MILKPRIPNGWHRMRRGTKINPYDRYFNFSYGRWMTWTGHIAQVWSGKSELFTPWFIRKNK